MMVTMPFNSFRRENSNSNSNPNKDDEDQDEDEDYDKTAYTTFNPTIQL